MVCEDDHGLCYCENDCTYLICNDCKKKLEENICPQCKCELKINIFFAGKIGELVNNVPCGVTRRYVLPEYNHTDNAEAAVPGGMDVFNIEVLNMLTNEKYGSMMLHPESIISYEHYIDLKRDLHVEPVNDTLNVTGPCVILDFNIINQLCVMHGCWNEDDIELLSGKDLTKISDIVNKRNREMIEKCHVFSLRLNDEFDCYRSIAEWGIASSLGKILILEPMDLSTTIKKNGANEFYLFATESIKTLEKLSFPRRNAIFKTHPRINMTYKECKEYMFQLINFKSSICNRSIDLSSDDNVSVSTHIG